MPTSVRSRTLEKIDSTGLVNPEYAAPVSKLHVAKPAPNLHEIRDDLPEGSLQGLIIEAI